MNCRCSNSNCRSYGCGVYSERPQWQGPRTQLPLLLQRGPLMQLPALWRQWQGPRAQLPLLLQQGPLTQLPTLRGQWQGPQAQLALLLLRGPLKQLPTLWR